MARRAGGKPRHDPYTAASTPARSGFVDLRPRRKPVDWEELARLYLDEGWSIAELARRTRYTLPGIRHGLRAHGVKLRKRPAFDEARRQLRSVWRGVLARAKRLTVSGRRVPLDKSWRRFEWFETLAAAYNYRPGTALVRLDPKKGFELDNVRFVRRKDVPKYSPRSHVMEPRRPITAFGETKGLRAWSRDRRCRVSLTVLSIRLRGGLAPEAAIATPPSQGRRGLVPNSKAARARVRPPIDWDKARRLYERGALLIDAARAVGADRHSVRDALVRLGVRLRARSSLTVTRDGRLLSKTWSTLRRRCSNSADPAYAYYGAKGIRVCREWATFKPFHDWALRSGWRPGRRLVRIDRRKGFSPGNCAFVTRREASLRVPPPARPRKARLLVTAFGESKSLAAWCRDRRCQVTATTLAIRLRGGMRSEEAITTEPKTEGSTGYPRRVITAFGETKAMARWLEDPRCRVGRYGLRLRLARGMKPEEALSTKPWNTPAQRRARALKGR